eukprot:scpid51834/ scgid30609/ 
MGPQTVLLISLSPVLVLVVLLCCVYWCFRLSRSEPERRKTNRSRRNASAKTECTHVEKHNSHIDGIVLDSTLEKEASDVNTKPSEDIEDLGNEFEKACADETLPDEAERTAVTQHTEKQVLEEGILSPGASSKPNSVTDPTSSYASDSSLTQSAKVNPKSETDEDGAVANASNRRSSISPYSELPLADGNSSLCPGIKLQQTEDFSQTCFDQDVTSLPSSEVAPRPSALDCPRRHSMVKPYEEISINNVGSSFSAQHNASQRLPEFTKRASKYSTSCKEPAAQPVESDAGTKHVHSCETISAIEPNVAANYKWARFPSQQGNRDGEKADRRTLSGGTKQMSAALRKPSRISKGLGNASKRSIAKIAPVEEDVPGLGFEKLSASELPSDDGNGSKPPCTVSRLSTFIPSDYLLPSDVAGYPQEHMSKGICPQVESVQTNICIGNPVNATESSRPDIPQQNRVELPRTGNPCHSADCWKDQPALVIKPDIPGGSTASPNRSVLSRRTPTRPVGQFQTPKPMNLKPRNTLESRASKSAELGKATAASPRQLCKTTSVDRPVSVQPYLMVELKKS